MTKALIVHNPVAGTQSAEQISKTIEKHMNQVGWEFLIHRTQEDEDIQAIVQSAAKDGYNLFIAAGGDGTVSAVASGLIGKDLKMAILPIGTGNGLARDLGIPLQAKKALSMIINSGNIRLLDAMEVKGRYFLLNFSAGLSPKAVREADRSKKREIGRLAYFIAGLHSLIGIQPHTFHLEIDGRAVRVRASEILVMNNVSIGDPGRYFNLGIENNDGKLDLFVIRSRTIIDFLRVIINVVLNRMQEDPDINRFFIRESIRIDANKPLIVQADGEIIDQTPIDANLVHKAVKIIVP